MDHHVATLQNDKYIVYEKPSGIYSFEHDGPMYSIQTQQIHEVCTLNHKMYIKKRYSKHFELTEARHVQGKRVSFKKDGVYNTPDVPEYEIRLAGKSKKFKMDDWLELVGIFIADGWYNKSKDSISIAATKGRKVKHIRTVCERLGISLKSYYSNTPDDVVSDYGYRGTHNITDRYVVRDLEEYSVGAIDKFLPEYVFNLNQRQSRILLESLLSCDGSSNNNGSEAYYTSSKKLAEDVAILVFHAGYSARITKIRSRGDEWSIAGRTGTLNADSLSVRINKSKNEPTINHGHIHTQNTQKEEIIQYKGAVMCITVSSHVFYCRETPTSPPSWTGNSGRSGRIPSGPKQQAVLPRGGENHNLLRVILSCVSC